MEGKRMFNYPRYLQQLVNTYCTRVMSCTYSKCTHPLKACTVLRRITQPGKIQIDLFHFLSSGTCSHFLPQTSPKYVNIK